MDEDRDKSEGLSRRAFLKRMAAVSFVVPVVSSFTIDAVAHALDDHNERPHQVFPNQYSLGEFFYGAVPNQYFPNQSFANQYFPNQHFPNQGRI